MNNGFFRSKGHPSINQAIYRYELPVKGSLICSKGISRVFFTKRGGIKNVFSDRTFGGRVVEDEVMATMNEMHIILVCTFDDRWS